MRRLFLGLCVFAAACAGEVSSSPTSPSGTTGGPALTEARGGTDLPFRGTLQSTETSQFQPPATLIAHLVGTGNATHLGLFTAVFEFTINTVTMTGSGHIILTAANGDRVFATETGQAAISAGVATIVEHATITGGTGRFAGATGSFVIQRSEVQATGVSSGSFTGTIDLAH